MNPDPRDCSITIFCWYGGQVQILLLYLIKSRKRLHTNSLIFWQKLTVSGSPETVLRLHWSGSEPHTHTFNIISYTRPINSILNIVKIWVHIYLYRVSSYKEGIKYYSFIKSKWFIGSSSRHYEITTLDEPGLRIRITLKRILILLLMNMIRIYDELSTGPPGL